MHQAIGKINPKQVRVAREARARSYSVCTTDRGFALMGPTGEIMRSTELRVVAVACSQLNQVEV